MERPWDNPWRRRLVLLLKGIVAAGILYGGAEASTAVFGTIRMWRHVRQTAPREAAAIAEWNREFGDLRALRSAFPTHPSEDGAARRLIASARDVGVELEKPREHGSPDSSRDGPYEAIRNYVNRELTALGPISVPPPSAQAYLEARRTALDSIERDLSAAGPVWKSAPETDSDSQVPVLTGILRLHRMLLARALAPGGQRTGSAQNALRASWNLIESLKDRPEFISQLCRIGGARLQMAALRRVDVEPEEWRPWLAAADYRSGLWKAMILSTSSTLALMDLKSSAFESATRVDYLDLERQFYVTLRESPVSDHEGDALDRMSWDHKDLLSAAPILASIAMPSLRSAWYRVDRLLVEVELTDKVLQLRGERARQGLWPTEIPGIDSSRVPGGRWIYARKPDGAITLAFNRKLQWKGSETVDFPLCFESP